MEQPLPPPPPPPPPHPPWCIQYIPETPDRWRRKTKLSNKEIAYIGPAFRQIITVICQHSPGVERFQGNSKSASRACGIGLFGFNELAWRLEIFI